MSRGPLVLGDFGHALFRLSRARATSRSVGFDVKEVLYPGFEGRPMSDSLDAFLEAVEMQVDVYRLSHKRPLVYATGFGALVLLALRARRNAPDLPTILQGGVPWGPARAREPDEVADLAGPGNRFDEAAERERFVVENFHSPLDADERRAFFSGFSTCTAYPRLVEWLDDDWFVQLESTLARRPPAIDGIRVWLGGQDDLTALDEHEAATRALGADWPTESVDHWGRFPYLDAPGPWIGALQTVGV